MTTPPSPPPGWYPDPAGTGGRAYWDGQTWGEPPKRTSHKLRNGLLTAFGVFVALVIIGNLLPKPEEDKPAASESTPTAVTQTTATTSAATEAPPSAPATTTTETTDPPGGRMPAIFCSFTGSSGEYYFQFVNPKGGHEAVNKSDKCVGSNRMFTQEEFQAVPGLKRQCVFDRDEDIKGNDGFVSIYSDETQGSIDAAKLICSNAGY